MACLAVYALTKVYFAWGVDYGIAVECIPMLATVVVGLLKYFNTVINRDMVKYILKLIESDSKRLKNCPEYRVLEKNAVEGRRYVISFIGFIFLLVTLYFLLSAALIANDLLTKNETEEKYLMYQVDYYFFDAQDYYFFTTIHNYILSAVVIFLVVPLDTMYITFIQHACALYAVTGYRLKTAYILDMNALKSNENLEKHKHKMQLSREEQEKVYRRVTICVEEHKNALAYTKVIQSMYSTTLFFQVSIGIMSISISGVLMLMKITNSTDVLRLGTWLIGQVFHLFFICLPGQRLMNFGQQLYYDALDCTWYSMHKKSQVIYQFLILNSLTPIALTAFKMTTLNLETFLAIIQAAMSYFTVLSSTLSN